MWRQTSGWVTCAKPSRRNTDPRVSHTFSRRFLKQNYPEYIIDVLSKILEKKEHNYQMFCLNLWSSWNWVSCGESWKSLLPIFLMFHRTDFGGFLVCCYKAIQQLNGVEKNYVAISLMLSHNLTGLLVWDYCLCVFISVCVLCFNSKWVINWHYQGIALSLSSFHFWKLPVTKKRNGMLTHARAILKKNRIDLVELSFSWHIFKLVYWVC